MVADGGGVGGEAWTATTDELDQNYSIRLSDNSHRLGWLVSVASEFNEVRRQTDELDKIYSIRLSVNMVTRWWMPAAGGVDHAWTMAMRKYKMAMTKGCTLE